MKEKWLNDLQARIQKEYHVSAPEGLLDDIKSEMLRRGITPKHSRQQKSRIVPLWLYSSISIAAVVVIGLYLFNASTNSSLLSDQAVTMLDHKANTTPNLTIKKTHSQDYTPSNTLKSGYSISKNAKQEFNHKHKINAEVHFDNSSLIANNTAYHTDQETVENNKPSAHHQETVESSVKENANKSQQPVNQRPIESHITAYNPHTKHDASPSRLIVGTSYSGTIGTSNTSQTPLLAAANPYGEYTSEFSGANIQRHMDDTEKAKVRAKHRPAVKFGISVRYNLNEHWSLQSGITYSKLSSTFKHKIADEHFDVEQNLYYVGLPVNVSYSLIRTKRLNVYMTAGGEVEKLVKGNAIQKKKHSAKTAQNNTSVTEHQPVFSMNAAVGGEYLLSNKISAYVEPGVSYYFKNGSNVENVYKDKPTNFNLNIGLRVALNNNF